MRLAECTADLIRIARVTAFGAGLTIASTSAFAQPVELNMIGSWAPGSSVDADIAIHFMEEVNRIGQGQVNITYRGAAEVVPVFDQPDAVVRGLFDVWFGAPNYWAGIVPAGYITELSPHAVPDEGPDSDLFQFMTKLYEPAGVRYLGHYSGDATAGNHYLITQTEVDSVDDLKGMQIRVPPLTRFFVAAAGAEPVTLPPGDIYVALDRGTVQGFTWPYFDTFTGMGWHEVSKYLINEPIYRNGVAVAMNLEKWNSLPEEAKTAITEAIRTTQEWAVGHVAEHQQKELSGMTEAGMQVVELSDEEAARWTKTANDALWDHFKTVMTEEDFAEASRLLGTQ